MHDDRGFPQALRSEVYFVAVTLVGYHEPALGQYRSLTPEELGEGLVALSDRDGRVRELGCVSRFSMHGDPFGVFGGVNPAYVPVVQCPVHLEQ